jgi:hypothetical protein
MKKQIEYALTNFETIPSSLSESNSGQLTVPMRSVCHQVYIDWLGSRVPRPNPIFLELSRFLTNSPELRFTKNGLGRTVEARRAQSTKYGKGFCRWFLSRYCGITHFADIGTIMNYSQNHKYRNVKVSRSSSGDLPDYLCADFNNKSIYLGEAKGVQSRELAFGNADFKKWQKQFQRLDVTGPSGKSLRLKGFIVATQFGKRGVSWKSKIFCEDPWTKGENPTQNDIPNLLDVVVLNHYVNVLNKMILTPEADAILNWYTVGRDKIKIGKYELIAGHSPGVEFYGSITSFGGTIHEEYSFLMALRGYLGIELQKRYFNQTYPSVHSVFFGVECETLKSIVNQARMSPEKRSTGEIKIRKFEYDQLDTDLFSYAADGTLAANGQAVRFVGIEEI